MGNTESNTYCRHCGNIKELLDNGKCYDCKGLSTSYESKYDDNTGITYDCKGHCKKCGNYTHLVKKSGLCWLHS